MKGNQLYLAQEVFHDFKTLLDFLNQGCQVTKKLHIHILHFNYNSLFFDLKNSVSG